MKGNNRTISWGNALIAILVILGISLGGIYTWSAAAEGVTEFEATTVEETAKAEEATEGVQEATESEKVTEAAQEATESERATEGAQYAETANGAETILDFADTVADASAIFAGDQEYHDMISITVPFLNLSDSVTWDFPYADEFFEYPSDAFNPELAKASLGLEFSAFRNDGKELDNQYETYLGAAGFSDIHAFGYDQPTSKDTLSGVIASKQIGDFTLIAAVPCGQGYQKEWAGNLEVGDEERHVGFNNAAGILEGQIRNYMEEHKITGTIKLWLTGFSRASAVANLTAADMIESGLFADVYAYLFAVPRTTKAPVAYPGIYNICGAFDPIPAVPMESYGYRRYGTDLYTPAQEVNSDYASLAGNASQVAGELTGKPFRNNPEINMQLHLILEFLAQLFPDSASYVQTLQQPLMDRWTEANSDQIFEILAAVLTQLDLMDQQQVYASQVLMDYLSYVVSLQLQGNTRQVADGSWDPDKGIGYNMFWEHLPATYLDWVFSENAFESVYNQAAATRRLIISGEVSVDVYCGEDWATGMDRNGKVSSASDSGESGLPVISIFREGTGISVYLPMDREYRVVLTADRQENLVYYDVIYSDDILEGRADKMYITSLEKGSYELVLGESDPMPELAALSGKIDNSLDVELEYSPLVLMDSASTMAPHLTIGSILVIMGYLMLLVVVVLLFSLVTAIVHTIRKKKRKKPYSDWFVIAPHLLIIITFTLLAQFFTFNLYSIGMVKMTCAAIATGFVFLLSLRAWIRYRHKDGLVYTLVLLVLTALTVLFYNRSPFASYSDVKMAIYGIGMLVLAVLAILSFYRGRKANV